jgi:hypothetical protein
MPASCRQQQIAEGRCNLAEVSQLLQEPSSALSGCRVAFQMGEISISGTVTGRAMHIDLVCGWAVLYGQAAALQPQHPRSATACQAARHCHMATAVEQAACCWCHAAAMQAARGIWG